MPPPNEDLIGREEENYVRALMEQLRDRQAPGGALQANWLEGQMASAPGTGAIYSAGQNMRGDIRDLQQGMNAQAGAMGASPLQARQAAYQGGRAASVGGGMARSLDLMGQAGQIGLERDQMGTQISTMQQMQQSELDKQRADEEAREKEREQRRREEQGTYDSAIGFMGVLSDERFKQRMGDLEAENRILKAQEVLRSEDERVMGQLGQTGRERMPQPVQRGANVTGLEEELSRIVNRPMVDYSPYEQSNRAAAGQMQSGFERDRIQFQSESPNEMESIRSSMDEADLMRLQQALSERFGGY
jgi:hypothetical protein